MDDTTSLNEFDQSTLTRRHWKWTTLSCVADYLDAATIVAGGAALTVWLKAFNMDTSLAAVLGAFGANGMAAALGALIAGYLGDKFGRKSIYSIDLLVYMFGALLIIFAVNPGMLIAGYIVMGLATGADVPTSWSLIAEFAPKRSRGKLMSMTNVFWYIGPIVVLLLAMALHPLGVLGMRFLFVSLFIVAAVTFVLRRSMLIESPRWTAVSRKNVLGGRSGNDTGCRADPGSSSNPKYRYRQLLVNKQNIKRLVFIAALFSFWNIPAGTYGFFYPYLFSTVGANGDVLGDFMQMMWFALGILGVLTVFAPLADRVNRKLLYAVSTICCLLAFLLLVFFPISNPVVAIANIVLFGFGQGIAIWPLQRVWSVELFPTEVRNTFQGISWFAMRMAIGLWSLLVPMAALGGLRGVAIVFCICFALNLVIGLIWAPQTARKSLEEIA